jgi:hypothetical protein
MKIEYVAAALFLCVGFHASSISTAVAESCLKVRPSDKITIDKVALNNLGKIGVTRQLIFEASRQAPRH